VTLSALGLAVGAPNLYELVTTRRIFFRMAIKENGGAELLGRRRFKHHRDV